MDQAVHANEPGDMHSPRTRRVEEDLAPLPGGALPQVGTPRYSSWLAGWQAFFSRSDKAWLAVLLVWLFAWLILARWVERYAIGLPYMDENHFVTIATGQEPLSWDFLYRANNEHRQPLVRLQIYLVGELTSWNFRHILQVNLGILAIGVLALLAAARAVRGKSHIADAFFCLAALHPYAYETFVWYSYSFTQTLGLFCISLALIASGWALRGRWHLIVYFLSLLALVCAGGPAGQIWAVGMCGLVTVLWLRRKALSWQVIGWSGTILVVAVVLAFLWMTPKIPHHKQFLNPTLKGLVSVGSRQAVSWLGRPLLEVTWPWITAVLLVPFGYLLIRGLGDVLGFVRRQSKARERLCTWVDLFPVLLCTLAVIGLIAYGRGKVHLWVSRYHTMLVPVALVTYMMLLRARAVVVLPGLMFVVMAISWGWCWPSALDHTRSRNRPAADLVKSLRAGQDPLMHVAYLYRGISWVPGSTGVTQSIGWWMAWRDEKLSVFTRMRDPGSVHAFLASAGKLGSTVHVVPDSGGVRNQAIHHQGPVGTAGKATYTFHLPTPRLCQIYVRALATTPNQSHAFTMDQRPARTVRLRQSPGYAPCLLCLANLEAGTHQLSLVLSNPQTRVDLIEVVPVRDEKKIHIVLQNDHNLRTTIPLSEGVAIAQKFVAHGDCLSQMDVRFVTYGDRHRPYPISWQLIELGQDGSSPVVRSGSLPAAQVKDWGMVTLKFDPIADSSRKTYQLVFTAPGTPKTQSLGLPVYETGAPYEGSFELAQSGKLDQQELTRCLWVLLHYTTDR